MNELLQRAIDNLELIDIYLRRSISHSEPEFDAKYSDFSSLIIQNKHHVPKYETLEGDGEVLFRVFVDVGVRWVEKKEEKVDEVEPAFIIEARFVAEYLMKENIDEECLKEFAKKNASYHVWPYWRELLSSQCERMRLPRITMPAIQFAHTD